MDEIISSFWGLFIRNLGKVKLRPREDSQDFMIWSLIIPGDLTSFLFDIQNVLQSDFQLDYH